MRKLAFVAVLAGCGDSNHVAPDASPDAPVSSIDGMVYDNNSVGIAGAMICVLHHPEIACPTTDATGAYTEMLPSLPGADLAIEVTADGYQSNVLLEQEPMTVGNTIWPVGVPLDSTAEAMTDLATDAGFTVPGTGGFLEVRIMGGTAGTLTGATATIAPVSGTGPVYRAADGTATPSATGTSSEGGALFGNVAVGVYEVTAVATGATCSVMPQGGLVAGDWPSTTGATTRVEVAEGAITTDVNIFCL